MRKSNKKKKPGRNALADYTSPAYNPREITDPSLDALRSSIEIFGDLSGIVLNSRNGHIICANQRRRALDDISLAKIEWSRPRTVELGYPGKRFRSKERTGVLELPGGARFSVREVDWPLAFEKAANVAANNPETQGIFTPDLAGLLDEIEESAGDNFTGLRFDALRDSLGLSEELVEGETDPDAVPETPAKPRSKKGSVYILGNHRLMCGDSTKKKNVERLMADEKADMVFTDPPYNVQIDYGTHDDNYSDEEHEKFSMKWLSICREKSEQVLFTPGTGRGLGMPNLQMWYRLSPPDWIIVWVKKNSVGHSSLGGFNNWEPIFFYGKPAKRLPQDIYDIPITVQQDVADSKGNKLHPTPKQVKLWMAVISDLTDKNDVLYDPFSGSGTTIIACEQLGRKCYAMEIEPKYVDVARRRWAEFIHGEGCNWQKLTPPARR